ncbi:hypothetical protein CB1_000639018 [Camelus ferus]|nr:hypothetical protein CB1_000639018 [Camelus ferus]
MSVHSYKLRTPVNMTVVGMLTRVMLSAYQVFPGPKWVCMVHGAFEDGILFCVGFCFCSYLSLILPLLSSGGFLQGTIDDLVVGKHPSPSPQLPQPEDWGWSRAFPGVLGPGSREREGPRHRLPQTRPICSRSASPPARLSGVPRSQAAQAGFDNAAEAVKTAV